MIVDINQLIIDIKNTVSGLLNKDIETVRGFSARQLTGISNQTALVASGITTGQITEATRDFFLDQLVELARNFVNTLVGLVIATIERLWNAVVKVIWDTISRVTGTIIPAFKPM
jgi:hypothetical protein